MKKLVKYILIFLLVMTTSAESIQKDKRKRTLGGKIATADSTGADQLQPLDEDWIELDISKLSFSAVDTIAISDTNLIARFQIGDKLELTQSGTIKWFFVIKINVATINVTAGDDFSYTDNAITRLRVSRLPLPQGFPATFFYSPTLTDEDETEITFIGDGGAAFEFTMIGQIVILALNILDADITANTSTVRIVTPFLYTGSDSSVFWNRYIRIADSAGQQHADITFFSSSVVTPRLDLDKEGGGNWAVGSFGVLTNFIFQL